MIKHQVVVDGFPTHYYIMNPERRRVMLVVHGFRGDPAGLAQIVRHWSDYKIIIPELPGHGETPPMTQDRHTIEGYGRWVRRFMQTLKLGPVVLVGHSFGSLVAARVAADSSEGIERLILINPVSESSRILALLGKAYYRIGLSAPDSLGRRWFNSRTISRMQSWLMMTTPDPDLRAHIYRHHLNDLRFPYYKEVIADATASVVAQNVL
ncbi:MAG TPA: alpha/beta fold hydrolase, partial [Candidatus Saccharimonadales bacterium]|nr:alpha/beta fold hydrolase [Candidatus Saccharimonadales bacterium]